MIAFILQRLLQSLAVLFTVGLIAFSMFRFAGDPVNQIVGVDTPYAERVAIRRIWASTIRWRCSSCATPVMW